MKTLLLLLHLVVHPSLWSLCLWLRVWIPSPLHSACLQPDSQMWSSTSGPLRFPFHSDWRAASVTDSYLVTSFLTIWLAYMWSIEKCSQLLGKKKVSMLSCGCIRGLCFSTGMSPDHTGQKNQSRNPRCYIQTIKYLSTATTDAAQLSK